MILSFHEFVFLRLVYSPTDAPGRTVLEPGVVTA
jgi:hypothetical protein